MSKQRAQNRAHLQAQRAEHAAAQAESAQRAAARASTRRRRSSGRQRLWRHLRIWQSTPSAITARSRERWSILIVAVLVALLLTYLFTSSWTAVLAVLLVTVVATPMLIAVVSDRSPR